MPLDKETLNALREQYPEGTRVMLTKMDDKIAPPVGTLGSVMLVDDTGTIHVRWDNGSLLGVLYGIDSCEKAD